MVPDCVEEKPGLTITDHGFRRMSSRGIPLAIVELAIEYGRQTFTRGGQVFAIGRNETRFWARRGVDLRAGSGVHVVCAACGPLTVLTVYRNHDLRPLRRGMRQARGLRGFLRELREQRRAAKHALSPI